MHPILFKIGSFPIHAYGFMVVVAFLAGILVSLYYAKKEGIKAEIILEVAILIILAAIVGSRLLFVICRLSHFKHNPNEIFAVRKGGLAFLGGFLLAVLGAVVLAKVRRISLLKLLDVLAPGTALGYAIARIGCFLSGCCFGLPTRLPWGLHFPPGSPAYSCYPDEYIHPTQLYALLIMCLVFLILTFLYRHKKYNGFIFFWWIVLYGMYRFPVEFLRYKPVQWLGLSPSQWIVLSIAILAGYTLLHKHLKSHNFKKK